MLRKLKLRWFGKRIVAYAYDEHENQKGMIIIKRYIIVKTLFGNENKIVRLNKDKVYNGSMESRYFDELLSKGYKPLRFYVYCTDMFKFKR